MNYTTVSSFWEPLAHLSCHLADCHPFIVTGHDCPLLRAFPSALFLSWWAQLQFLCTQHHLGLPSVSTYPLEQMACFAGLCLPSDCELLLHCVLIAWHLLGAQ